MRRQAMTRAESEARLDLLMIQAKYDGGGMPPALYSVLKQIEVRHRMDAKRG